MWGNWDQIVLPLPKDRFVFSIMQHARNFLTHAMSIHLQLDKDFVFTNLDGTFISKLL